MMWHQYIERKLQPLHIDQHELYFADVESTTIEVKDQQVECFTTSHSKGLSLRIIDDKRMGFSYTTDVTHPALDRVITNALMSARNTSADEWNAFPSTSMPLPELDLWDPHVASISKDEKIDTVKRLEKEAITFDRRIKKVRKATYQERCSTVSLLNSNGFHRSHRRTFVSCSIDVVAEEKGDSQMGWDVDFSCFYHDLDVAKTGRSAALRAIELLGAKPIPSFKGAVVLDKRVASQFLGVLAPSFLAESVQKNKSVLKGKMETKIVSDKIHLIDDGLYPKGVATTPFDGEGVARQSTQLVEKGILKTFLYDTYCAKKADTHSTGNSTRGSIQSPPRVGCSNLYITNGNENPDALLSHVDTGLFVSDVMGIHTANPLSGDFSVGVHGCLIQHGNKSTPVKGVAIAGNVLRIFDRVVAVGNDLRFYGHTGSPSLLIEDMDISGN